MHDRHVGSRRRSREADRLRRLARQRGTSVSDELRRAVESLLSERA
jgi:hypothetical protein